MGDKGQFQKGHMPITYKSVGTIRERKKDKGIARYIKVKDPNKWQVYARWLWEQDWGALIEGDRVVHLNRENLDDRIENLLALPKSAYVKFSACKQDFTRREQAKLKKRYFEKEEVKNESVANL